MSLKYEIKLWEDEIERDEIGNITHHPINSRYYVSFGNDLPSYGYLTFAGHDLDKSQILGDLHFFYLQFFSLPTAPDGREAWADPLRIKILQRLTDFNRSWYLSIIGSPMDIPKQTNFPRIDPLQYVIVQSEKQYGDGHGFIPRLFVEATNPTIPTVVKAYWSMAVPGYPIEGYNMESNQIDLLREWANRPRDDSLFREVMGKSFIAFYTYPAENQFFVFVTNKLNIDDLKKFINIEELRQSISDL